MFINEDISELNPVEAVGACMGPCCTAASGSTDLCVCVCFVKCSSSVVKRHGLRPLVNILYRWAAEGGGEF